MRGRYLGSSGKVRSRRAAWIGAGLLCLAAFLLGWWTARTSWLAVGLAFAAGWTIGAGVGIIIFKTWLHRRPRRWQPGPNAGWRTLDRQPGAETPNAAGFSDEDLADLLSGWDW